MDAVLEVLGWLFWGLVSACTGVMWEASSKSWARRQLWGIACGLLGVALIVLGVGVWLCFGWRAVSWWSTALGGVLVMAFLVIGNICHLYNAPAGKRGYLKRRLKQADKE
ncbi:hypothetical protein [Lignipirellula cremea]|uniref:Uncharacterized protein n=1 Tax=Lignipirellula cremea TaxID=2528010 RepID=A0A518DMK8_9BACT|nr:hypothetical protein [Lignipirellula cremea]QDU93070.1 hypothetical protein Pla8534_08470 [Lignipirellula cremea]